jgi:preprotein translocase subunit SecD
MVIFVALVGLLVFDLALGNTPVLGLDLQGGVSVILAPTGTRRRRRPARDPRSDPRRARAATASPNPTSGSKARTSSSTCRGSATRPRRSSRCRCRASSSSAPWTAPDESVPTTTAPGASLDNSQPATTVEPEESATGAAGRGLAARGRSAVPAAAPDSTVPPTTEAPVFGPPAPTTTLPPDTTGQITVPNQDGTELCVLGPPAGTGEVFVRKSAGVDIDLDTGGWVVNADLRGEGEVAWNAIAQQCYNGTPTCPAAPGGRGRLAIVLDGIIQSAPTVNAPSFAGAVTISGDFTEDEARDLAQTINRGAFPVQVEPQRVETVSPTAGESALNAAIIAGLIGVGLTLLYMIAYYRKLSVVIIAGLAVWGLLIYVLATYISRETNFAFTIAGATGIIVSIGVTVDTYIVFFERLKDEVRAGRTLRNAAPRAFNATWKTIFAANFVALLSSVVLFFLSVGSVRGFALYLGVTTICDVVVFWFFTRPLLFLLADTKWFDSSNPKSLGIGTAIGGTQ